MLEIKIISLLQDNYAYLLVDLSTGATAVVDPSEARPVVRILEEMGLRLDFILNTHHHWDHTGGNLELKKSFGSRVVGARHDSHRIPGIDIEVDDSAPFFLGKSEAKILMIPGHTLGHIAFYFSEDDALFCGDTLFSIGCGRLFEGAPEQMWQSLNLIKSLPPQTKIYCGHEYTEANIQFAKTLNSKNKDLLDYESEVKEIRGRHLPTIPTTLKIELFFNPFLKTKNSLEFAEIRKMKDEFRI